MSKKYANLHARFNEFRGQTVALKEAAWVETAVQISQYVEKTRSIEAIKTDFANGISSPIYEEFEKSHGKRSMGALLYGKLSLDEYIKNNLKEPNVEKAELTELSQILGAIYLDAKNNLNKLDPLLKKANTWLTEHAATTPNKENAYKLCQALYTMTTCLNIRIAQLGRFHKALAGPELISKATGGLQGLLAAIETTAKVLETQLAKKAKAEGGKEKTMGDHFNDRYLAIMNKEGDDELTRLATIKSTANEATTDINALLAKGQEKVKLALQIVDLQELLRAANENDTRPTGRQYFQELVSSNQANYDVLLKAHPQSQDIESLRKSMETPTRLDSVKYGALYLGSVFSSPLAAVARKFTPKVIKDTVSGFVPDTNDSLAKHRLIELTKAVLRDMNAELQTKQQEISDIETRLAGGNIQLQKYIEDSTPQTLRDLVTVNNTAVDIVDEYTKVRQPIEALGQRLEKIKNLDSNVSGFIQENNKVFKKIVDWFSRFGKWFSTESLSEKITAAKTLKKDLGAIKDEHEKRLAVQMTKFNENPDISDPIKMKLKQQLEDKTSLFLSSPSSNRGHSGVIKEYRHALNDLQAPNGNGEAPKVEQESDEGLGHKL